MNIGTVLYAVICKQIIIINTIVLNFYMNDSSHGVLGSYQTYYIKFKIIYFLQFYIHLAY